MSDGDIVVRKELSPVTVISQFVLSSVGSKFVMAVTGLMLWGFVIGHLVGNLQIFAGAKDSINEYAVFLHEVGHGAVLWGARGSLLLAVTLHIVLGIRLAKLNRQARPTSYATRTWKATNPATLYMAFSGTVILAFIIGHLLHFTIRPGEMMVLDDKNRPDVFLMVHQAFSNPWIVFAYVAAQAVLLLHLFHGTQSLFQSVGFYHPVWTPVIRVAGRAVAALIFIGNLAIPLVIFLVWSKP
jgi:succinate dehydrogenase / fumarate reductase, cytochrome b subunit